ncbi:MAG: cellobiose phosphorylase [Bifidobacterium choerinum]
MKYGHFDDARREYVIETPATPLPWINYLGNEDFFSLISNTAGGYSFYKDAKLRRITRYRYNGVPADEGARSFYLTLMEPDDGAEPAADAALRPVASWSPTFLPLKTPLDSYECRHGMGYSVFRASYAGIDSELTAFVPLHTPAEINKLTLTNTTDAEKIVDATACVEWCLWNAVDDASNFQRNLSTGEVEIEQSDEATLIYHKTEFKERRNHYAFYSVNEPTVGYDTVRDEFLGKFNG